MGEAACHGGEIVVKNDLAVVAEVRRFVRLVAGRRSPVAGRWEMDDFVPCLVASELITNALRYASAPDGDVTFRIGRTEDGALWMEVQDETCDMPRIQCADTISETAGGCSSWTSSRAAGASVRWPGTQGRSSSQSSTPHEDRRRGHTRRLISSGSAGGAAR
ncbi:hypothetical protein GCM10023088_10110 [Actinomadura verrucosospora]